MMRSIIICSCGAAAIVHDETPDRGCVSENPTWKFIGGKLPYRLGMTHDEIDAISPESCWCCGEPGHFQLIVLNAKGEFQSARDIELYSRHMTPAMRTLIEMAMNGELVAR